MEICTKNILYRSIEGQTSTNGNDIESNESTIHVQIIMKIFVLTNVWKYLS